MMTDLLIGFGEVGQALHAVLSERRPFVVVDPAKGMNPEPGESVEWAHVCIPWSDNVVTLVSEYARIWKPAHIILHSTLKVGTTRKVQRECDYIPTYYSPVRGRHPHLATAIRQFPKWYATDLPGQADDDIVAYYANAGIQSRRAPSLEFLELAKLWETTSYGYNLVMWQEIEREVSELPGIKSGNLSAMKTWLYEKRKCYDGDLGMVPVYDLIPGPIGGHCILSNVDLLQEKMTPELYAWLTKSNEMRKEK